MEINTNNFSEKADKFFNEKKFDEIIELLTDELLEKQNDADLYVKRGVAWYNKEEYDKAIKDYNEAITINSNYELAFYNRGLAQFATKEYDKAIEDYTKAMGLNPDNYVDNCYTDRGNAWKAKGKYKEAIDDYTSAIKIKPDFETAYYSRGLARKEEKIDLEGSKQDFEIYLKLTTGGNNELSIKYAKYYIEELNERINDKELSDIADLVANIKEVLRIKEDRITHYTSLSALKKLIFEESKFRISEGNFMNDPSEGKEFFKFLEYKPYTSYTDGSFFEFFSPKPFIGSFVAQDMHDDLNMWRFYGKEDGAEAKGCSVTLCTEFIDEIKDSLSNEKEKAREVDESDLKFYLVAYLTNGAAEFYIPDLEKSKKLKSMIESLKNKVKNYPKKDKSFLEKYLNSIAFLFKNDAYKNENEVRLVVKGIEYEKKFDMNANPPRVYIEFNPIKKMVKQITLGPKVDNVSEWASAFHYSFGVNAPEIIISHLPYK